MTVDWCGMHERQKMSPGYDDRRSTLIDAPGNPKNTRSPPFSEIGVDIIYREKSEVTDRRKGAYENQ